MDPTYTTAGPPAMLCATEARPLRSRPGLAVLARHRGHSCRATVLRSERGHTKERALARIDGSRAAGTQKRRRLAHDPGRHRRGLGRRGAPAWWRVGRRGARRGHRTARRARRGAARDRRREARAEPRLAAALRPAAGPRADPLAAAAL